MLMLSERYYAYFADIVFSCRRHAHSMRRHAAAMLTRMFAATPDIDTVPHTRLRYAIFTPPMMACHTRAPARA